MHRFMEAAFQHTHTQLVHTCQTPDSAVHTHDIDVAFIYVPLHLSCLARAAYLNSSSRAVFEAWIGHKP